MSTTIYDDYFVNGPSSDYGGGGGAVIPINAGTLIFSRQGSMTTGSTFRIPTTNVPMTYNGRGYKFNTSFSFQNYVYWGNTDDTTSIGIELRHMRIVGGSPVIVKNQIFNVPSVAAAIVGGFAGTLPQSFEVEPGDYFYARCLASTDGGTASSVSNAIFIFEVER